jgi:hypothetical protein
MRLVLAAALAKLLQLKTAYDGLFVLRRRVVALLALGAFQRNDFPHIQFLPLTDESLPLIRVSRAALQPFARRAVRLARPALT